MLLFFMLYMDCGKGMAYLSCIHVLGTDMLHDRRPHYLEQISTTDVASTVFAAMIVAAYI